MLAGVASFVLYAVATAILLRFDPRSPSIPPVVASICVYFAGIFGASLLWGVNFWAFSSTYWFFTLCFLMAFGAIYKSVSLRMLLDLSLAPDQTMHRDMIYKRYIGAASYHQRIDIIQQNAFAMRTEQGFVLTPRGRSIAKLVAFLQGLFAIERSG